MITRRTTSLNHRAIDGTNAQRFPRATRYQVFVSEEKRDNPMNRVGVRERYLDQFRCWQTQAGMRVAFRHRLFNKQGTAKWQVASSTPRLQ